MMKYLLLIIITLVCSTFFAQKKAENILQKKISNHLNISIIDIDSIIPLYIDTMSLYGAYNIFFENNDLVYEVLYIQGKIYHKLPFHGRKFNRINNKLKKYFSSQEIIELYQFIPFESIPNM